MMITIDNFKIGIDWWLKQKKNWPPDILNKEYYDIYKDREIGINLVWWEKTVYRLSRWRACRPLSKREIYSRGEKILDQISKEYDKLSKNQNLEPSISDLHWEGIQTLFLLVRQIKQTISPVFAGKMCHFIFPKVFIVMDNYATSVSNYELYWQGMKEEWNRFNEKKEAIELLTRTINSDKLHSLYPFETKIIELSHIGYKHKQIEPLQKTVI